ncbi:hypothetical protein NWP96_04300 [Mycoplasmopsis cynos]|nr:hypothetical protein [Mycoplasmopsis cynos]
MFFYQKKIMCLNIVLVLIIKNDDKVLLAYDGETNNYKYLPGKGRILANQYIKQLKEKLMKS